MKHSQSEYHASESLVQEDFILENHQAVMEQEEPFESYLHDKDWWSDEKVQEKLDIFVLFDDYLDKLPRRTANMMRLERFRSWCNNGGESEYVCELDCFEDIKIYLIGIDNKFSRYQIQLEAGPGGNV